MAEKYTLAEARAIIAQERCAESGHDLLQDNWRNSITKEMYVKVWCERCGTKFEAVKE